MQIVKPSVEWVPLEGDPLQVIERAGRSCYKSENKITDKSAEPFVKTILEKGHEAMIEFSNFIFSIHQFGDRTSLIRHLKNHFTRISDWYISGNARAFRDLINNESLGCEPLRELAQRLTHINPILFDFGFGSTDRDSRFSIMQPDQLNGVERLVHEALCYRVICDRGISHEIVRHRVCSFAQESTRFCNYASGRFDNGISVIIPEEHLTFEQSERRKAYIRCGEKLYESEIREGVKAQIARGILPTSLKTEITICTNLWGWGNFMFLRLAKDAHPQAREIATMIHDHMRENLPTQYGIVMAEADDRGLRRKKGC
jgi:thymidylate synthase (FAD)